MQCAFAARRTRRRCTRTHRTTRARTPRCARCRRGSWVLIHQESTTRALTSRLACPARRLSLAGLCPGKHATGREPHRGLPAHLGSSPSWPPWHPGELAPWQPRWLTSIHVSKWAGTGARPDGAASNAQGGGGRSRRLTGKRRPPRTRRKLRERQEVRKQREKR